MAAHLYASIRRGLIVDVFSKKTRQTAVSVIENCSAIEGVRSDSIGRSVMKAAGRRRLERAGWAVGDAAEFLGLSAQEAALSR